MATDPNNKGGAATRTKRQEHAYYEVWKKRQAGKLPKPDGHRCSTCGGPASETHHSDYGKPTRTTYMCASCNRKRGKGKNA